MTKVTGVICEECGQIIFSRARHDFRSCVCGHTSVDGGFDYVKVCGSSWSLIELEIKATKQELYHDWNSRRDEY